MRLSEYASTRKTRGSYKMPRSVQQSIPIDRIYADGVWQSGNVFSMMWQISDINYAMQSDAAKQNILTQLGTVYAGIPADCWMQVCIVSQRMDEKAFARDVLYHRENDGFDALRAERNRQIKANARENGNVVQHKYIIVSTNKPGVKEARERFVQVQGHLLSAFSALECAVTPLDNRARLEVLHKFFRISEEGRFNFDFDNCAKLGQDFRDSIAPDCIRFCKKHIEIEDFCAKCMTISEYPQQLDDKFISALLQQVPYIVLSIDIEPVETEDTHIKRYIDQGIPPICHCLPVSLSQHWVVPFKYTNGSGWDSNRDRFSNQCHRTDTNWQVNATKRACLSGRGYCPNAVHQPAGSLYTVQHNNGFPCAAYRHFDPSQQGQL